MATPSHDIDVRPDADSDSRAATVSPTEVAPRQHSVSISANRKLKSSAKTVGLCFLLIAATWAIYQETARNAFVNYDDFQYVVINPHVRTGLTWNNALWAVTTGYFYNWHPLTWLSHMLDVQIFGLRAAGHHLTSVFIHTTNALLLFGILLAMTGAFWRSAAVAAIFSVHPLNVESVAWIAERKTVLCALFGFLTIWAYIKYTRRPGLRNYGLILTLYALGLMAKPMLVTLPFLLLLLDIWPLGRFPLSVDSSSGFFKDRFARVFRLVGEKLPLFALSLASCVVTMIVQKSGGAIVDLTSMPFRHRLANALVSYVMYIEKIFWPLRLALFYPQQDFSTFTVTASTLAVFGITCLAVLAARKRPYFIVGWLWYVGSLVPVIGIVQVGEQAMADRYAYIPMIGIAIMIVWGAGDVFSKFPKVKLAQPAFAGLALLLLILTSQTQVRYWNNSVVLWAHTLAVTSNNYIAHANLGTALGARGHDDEGIAELKKAVEICPGFVEAHNSLGVILARTGKLDEAVFHFSAAIRVRPTLTDAHNNLAKAFADRGRIDEAIQEYREVVRIDPGNETAVAALKQLGSRDRQTP